VSSGHGSRPSSMLGTAQVAAREAGETASTQKLLVPGPASSLRRGEPTVLAKTQASFHSGPPRFYMEVDSIAWRQGW
jgi:hypothetical protein